MPRYKVIIEVESDKTPEYIKAKIENLLRDLYQPEWYNISIKKITLKKETIETWIKK